MARSIPIMAKRKTNSSIVKNVPILPERKEKKGRAILSKIREIDQVFKNLLKSLI